MRIILPSLFILLAAPSGFAQVFGGASPSQKAIQETAVMLQQARRNADAESALRAADRSADNGRLDQIAAEARIRRAQPVDDDGAKLVDAADRRLEPAMKSASPEGKLIIAQSSTAPVMRAPEADAPVSALPGAKAAAGQKPAAGKKGKDAATPPTDIDIHSEGAVYLDSAQALAIFTDDVVVDHPQFHLTSDKLEVYFIKEEEKKKSPEPPPAAPVTAGSRLAEADAPAKPEAAPGAAEADQSKDTQLKQAIATGRKVVIRKLDENGEAQIGICRHATYLGESGDIILREKPQVQRGNNVIIARVDSTYMVLKQNGELKVFGPADTKIVQKNDGDARPKKPAKTPAGNAPAEAAKPAKPPKAVKL